MLAAYLAWYPDDVAGLVFLDAVGPGSVAGFARPGILPENWDPRADVDRIAGVSFGSRPVVVLTTTLEADGADIRRRGTNVLVAHAPQFPHIVLVEVPGLAYESRPRRGPRPAQRRPASSVRGHTAPGDRRALLALSYPKP